MRATAIIISFLAGPALLLILARRLGGEKLVHRIWRWGFRWIYGLIFAVYVIAMIHLMLFEGIEGDDGPGLFAGFVLMVAFAVSGTITLATYKLLTLEPRRNFR